MEAWRRVCEEARGRGEEASNVICHIMTNVNMKVGNNVKSEVSNHWANCLNQDNPLNPPYQGDRIKGFTGLKIATAIGIRTRNELRYYKRQSAQRLV